MRSPLFRLEIRAAWLPLKALKRASPSSYAGGGDEAFTGCGDEDLGVGGGGVPAIEAVAVLTTANLEAGIGDAITEVIVGAGVRCILIDGKWVCTT